MTARLTDATADRYRIERELGQGGMATVYLAQDLKHKRWVAVKVLKPELAAVLGAERFVQEITTTAALQHPHILPLFDSGEAGGFLYYVMPFIDGETLRSKLNRETQLGIEESIRIATDVASALHYAHQHGVIHRDIKPENILLHDGRPMVADFGIALAVSAAAGGRMTETGLSLGTPHYMSPEQATAEKEITARSDTYSLASVLYEMLTGSPPHVGASAQQIIMKIVTEEAQPVTKLRRAVPPNVAAAVAQALEKLPADRFDSARAFGEALQNPGFTTVRMAVTPRAAAPLYQRPVLLATIAVVACALALSGWLRSPHSAERGRPWRTRIMLPGSAQVGSGISLSADGSVLIYDGSGQLWLRTARAVDPVPIAGTRGAEYPAISPDGRRVAFLLRASLAVMPLTGGEPSIVMKNVPYASWFDWMDDDHIVLPVVGGLVRVTIADGNTEPLTTIDSAAGDIYHISSSSLPDGKGALFTIFGRNPDSSVIAVVGPKGGKVTRLLVGMAATYARPNHLIVSRADGSIIAVPFDVDRRQVTGSPVSLVAGLRTGAFSPVGFSSVSDDGRLIYIAGGATTEPLSELVWVDRSGGATQTAPGWTGLFQSVALSRDGRRTAVGVYDEQSEHLLIRDLTSGSVVRVVVPPDQLRDPVFSPDGQQVYFAALGTNRLLRVKVGGRAAPEQVTEAGTGVVGSPAFARDGELLYYQARSGEKIQLFRRTLSAGTSDTAVYVGVGGRHSQPSPDGLWLAFLTTNGAQTELHVRSTDMASSEDWRVRTSVNSRTSIRWSRAGDELFFVADDSLMAARISTSASFNAGAPRALFSTSGLRPVFDLAPDGRFLMIRARPDLQPPAELVMLERWTDLLTK